jgi:hypothetical protein
VLAATRGLARLLGVTLPHARLVLLALLLRLVVVELNRLADLFGVLSAARLHLRLPVLLGILRDVLVFTHDDCTPFGGRRSGRTSGMRKEQATYHPSLLVV